MICLWDENDTSIEWQKFARIQINEVIGEFHQVQDMPVVCLLNAKRKRTAIDIDGNWSKHEQLEAIISTLEEVIKL